MLESKAYDKVISQYRGGIWDIFITAMTFGNFGIETRIVQTTLKPVTPDKDGIAPLSGTSAEVALREHRVVITNFGPRTERKIIRTPKFKK